MSNSLPEVSADKSCYCMDDNTNFSGCAQALNHCSFFYDSTLVYAGIDLSFFKITSFTILQIKSTCKCRGKRFSVNGFEHERYPASNTYFEAEKEVSINDKSQD